MDIVAPSDKIASCKKCEINLFTIELANYFLRAVYHFIFYFPRVFFVHKIWVTKMNISNFIYFHLIHLEKVLKMEEHGFSFFVMQKILSVYTQTLYLLK